MSGKKKLATSANSFQAKGGGHDHLPEVVESARKTAKRLTGKEKTGKVSTAGKGGPHGLLTENFSVAAILQIEAERRLLDENERMLYCVYIFGDTEPTSRPKAIKGLNQFLARMQGVEPSRNAEKDFLVRALQHYARKWNLELNYLGNGKPVPCRISTAPNRDPKYLRAFRLVEPGRSGKTLASRNSLPELAFSA